MNKELYQAAYEIIEVQKLSNSAQCGSVGSALLTRRGDVYTGICIDCSCSIGFCAEHAAVAEMLKNRESEIKEIIAVNESGEVMPPCGRCRELILQINIRNKNTLVYLPGDKQKKMEELMPEIWNG